MKRVCPEKIYGISMEGNYTRIHLRGVHYLVRSTMAAMLKKLPPDIFIKVHRSFVISIYYMNNIDRDHLLIGKDVIPIGKQYYKSLMEQLNVIE